MAIKRGVSFYSYQQAHYVGDMDYVGMFRELREGLNCDGVEIINEATAPGYPFPSREWLATWHSNLARYDLNAVCFDGFLDTMRLRTHTMNEAEAAELVKVDLQLAHDMGFKHIRTMTALPIETIARALPTAEKLDVKIGWEIHTPIPIKPDPSIRGKYRRTSEGPGESVQETVEFIEKIGTKHVGFVPDMGIFSSGPMLSGANKLIISIDERDPVLAAEMREVLDNYPVLEVLPALEKNFGSKLTPEELAQITGRMTVYNGSVAQPEDLTLILPYVLSFHGKTHYNRPKPGHPGQFEDPSFMYEEVIEVLKDNNWDGYICTEFEGQGSGRGYIGQPMVDEVEQVRRHHEMLKRLIGE